MMYVLPSILGSLVNRRQTNVFNSNGNVRPLYIDLTDSGFDKFVLNIFILDKSLER